VSQVCNRGGFAPHLIRHFVQQNQHQFLEAYCGEIGNGRIVLPQSALRELLSE
jgi:hypothetical protein